MRSDTSDWASGRHWRARPGTRCAIRAVSTPSSAWTARTIERRTPFIFVGNNCYVLEGFGLGRRARLDDGVLSLYVLRPKSALGFLWLGLRSLLGHRFAMPATSSHSRPNEFQVAVAARGDEEVAIDGEGDLHGPADALSHPQARAAGVRAASRDEGIR